MSLLDGKALLCYEYSDTELRTKAHAWKMREAMMKDRWLSVDEIGARLGVSRSTVYPWIDYRGLPAHKVGRLSKFKKDKIEECVRAGHAGKEDEADDSPPWCFKKPRR